MIWSIKSDPENCDHVYHGDEKHYHSYRDDILKIAFESQKNGTLLQISFEEDLIKEHNYNLLGTKFTAFPKSLKY